MIKALIIEDEEPAAKRLSKMLVQADMGIEIAGVITSVSEGITWFSENGEPDLLITDINLADGLCFEIFKQVKVTCPVIFTTAFDQYAIDAFKMNSIDYLLKPIKQEDLETALHKFDKFFNKKESAAKQPDLSGLLKYFTGNNDSYKERFVVKYGEHIKAIDVNDIAYFFTKDKVSILATHDGKNFSVDYNMEKLEELLNPKQFFRINRQFIINLKAITEMVSYSKSRVKIKLKPATDLDTIVSAERSSDFKNWLAGGK
jgi:DNA-binding LytR/AlgR family response regulator